MNESSRVRNNNCRSWSASSWNAKVRYWTKVYDTGTRRIQDCVWTLRNGSPSSNWWNCWKFEKAIWKYNWRINSFISHFKSFCRAYFNGGSTSFQSPTIPKRASRKILASGSLFIATINLKTIQKILMTPKMIL